MSFRITDQATLDRLIANHGELYAAVNDGSFPTWGIRFSDGYPIRDYIAYYREGAGIDPFVIFDCTAFDSNGQRIDPALLNKSTIGLYVDAVVGGVTDSAKQVANGAIDFGQGLNNVAGSIAHNIVFYLVLALIIWLIISGNMSKLVKGVSDTVRSV